MNELIEFLDELLGDCIKTAAGSIIIIKMIDDRINSIIMMIVGPR